jgi:hypothetical protein
MKLRLIWQVIALLLTMGMADTAWAVDSYRYLHVTIETPWTIFVFLFFMVFAPMILAVILYWRHALRKDEDQPGEGEK